MAKKSINVIGIMIGAKYEDFKLYQMHESWEKNVSEGTYTETGISSEGSVEGAKDILGFLSLPLDPSTQFVVMYDVTCSKKEEHLKEVLTGINKIKKNDLLPTLISIGHEQSPLDESIKSQVSVITEIANTGSPEDLLKDSVSHEFHKIKKKLLAGDKNQNLLKNTPNQTTTNNPEVKSSQTTNVHSSSAMSISMMVLGGFIAAAGIAAVAVAFTVLNAATFGVAGLVVAGVGIAATLAGVGLFSTGAYKNRQADPDLSLQFADSLVHI